MGKKARLIIFQFCPRLLNMSDCSEFEKQRGGGEKIDRFGVGGPGFELEVCDLAPG